MVRITMIEIEINKMSFLPSLIIFINQKKRYFCRKKLFFKLLFLSIKYIGKNCEDFVFVYVFPGSILNDGGSAIYLS